MESAVDVLPSNFSTSRAFFPKGHKRLKPSKHDEDYDGMPLSPCIRGVSSDEKKPTFPTNVVDYSDPFAYSDLFDRFESGKFGSVTKDIQALVARRTQMLSGYFAKYPMLSDTLLEPQKDHYNETEKSFSDSKVGHGKSDVPAASLHVVIIDSDEEDVQDQKPSCPFQEVVLMKPAGQFLLKDMADYQARIECFKENVVHFGGNASTAPKDRKNRDEGVYLGVEEHAPQTADDGLGDIWKEMSMALECSKAIPSNPLPDEQESEDDDDCDHSFILKDDIGYVCRICGIVDKRIETIFEFQFNKVKKSTRTYMRDSWQTKDKEYYEEKGLEFPGDNLLVTEIAAHPRHAKQMKPHQVEGFNFLVSNLVGDNPGGCILAHAPGSGKTFMIISFMQSFLAKYPNGRPLVILPKGILATWKKEFQIWQVEDMPLYDFYSVKADTRYQQLDVLKRWVENKSILFLGYKQFSSIVCDSDTSKASMACQDILLKAPSILILDEGHTPRNENTDVLQSLAKVQTPRKVVLSGTLYQNHVKEVFNILNLVRPKFLRLESSRTIVKRILSRVHIPAVRKQFKSGVDTAFYELVEHTLQKDTDFKRKVNVIQDLREMTSNVLHYYKGDFLDELPGLVDYTVVLNLSSKQKHEAQKLKHLARKFKISSVGSAVYLHPKLNSFSENSAITDSMMDDMIEKIDVKDGVKAKFFLNVLGLCESAGEKLLVFSQYLLPLKFLERLAAMKKGWSPGREIFVISGESSSEHREWSMERFNNSPDAKVFFGSIKACGEGISLVGASRVIILDVHLNPSVTRQAIGRAFRPGQTKKVYCYRLLAAATPEEDDHRTCFKKELIAKMWFEWNEYCGYQNFEVATIDVEESGDLFLESPLLREDIKVLYKR